jgi:acyl-CoA synthetase (NDP forming)
MSSGALDHLFNPGSIAIVGLPRGFKASKIFLYGLLDQGFAGPIYLVHPSAEQIDGLKAYPAIADIPGPVDQVIVLAPKSAVWETLNQCANKGVKAVVIYTAGFGESGEAGARDEQRLRKMADAGGFRVLGPNCMGVYSPSAKLAFLPGMPKEPGSAAFLSQSGSLTNMFPKVCADRGVYFRHAVSYGSGADIDLPELLDYVASDPEVKVICSYCEGVRDGRALRESLKKTAGNKPVIIWKAGHTASGRKASASHTGSMTGEGRLWKSLFQQCGAIEAFDIEDLCDTVMAFCRLPVSSGGRVALLSGPGGPGVTAADAVDQNGLQLAALSDLTTRRLEEIIPDKGTSLKNPVDVALSASFELDIYLDSLQAILEDDNVDAAVIIGGGMSEESDKKYIQGLVQVKPATDKALIVIGFPGFLDDEDQLSLLYKAGIPAYPTPERALRSYGKLVKFSRFRKARGIT